MLALLLPAALAAPIVGGEPAEPGDWPSATAVYYGQYDGCTGVLIAPDVALTAGHCASDNITEVLIGSVDLWDESQGERIAVRDYLEHPVSQESYDVTILWLAEPAETPPVPLLHGCALDALVEGAPVWIVGYGATDEWGNADTNLLMAAETTITDTDCDDLDRGCREYASPGGELIAGGDGVDSCYGDSGGPLYLKADWGETYLAGLTSRAAIPSTVECGDGGIYVRLDAIVDWLRDETGLAFEAPDCAPNTPPTPGADPITVLAGEIASTIVWPGDPDPDDTHRFEIVGAAHFGEATIDGTGVLVYRAPDAYTGGDGVTVSVSDGHDTTELKIEITVYQTGEVLLTPTCGCGAGAAAGAGGAWLALVLAGWRRRADRAG